MRGSRSTLRLAATLALVSIGAGAAVALAGSTAATVRAARARPRLAVQIDGGTMARYLTRPGEKEALLQWVDRGAPEGDWNTVGRILSERCVSCHNPETGVQGLGPLDRYASAARMATVPRPKIVTWSLAAPVGLLVAVGVGLRRMWAAKRS